MLSPETLESYRRMTPAERLRLTLDLSRSAWSAMLEGDEAIVARRFEKLSQDNDLRNRRIVHGLRIAEGLPVLEGLPVAEGLSDPAAFPENRSEL